MTADLLPKATRHEDFFATQGVCDKDRVKCLPRGCHSSRVGGIIGRVVVDNPVVTIVEFATVDTLSRNHSFHYSSYLWPFGGGEASCGWKNKNTSAGNFVWQSQTPSLDIFKIWRTTIVGEFRVLWGIISSTILLKMAVSLIFLKRQSNHFTQNER